MHAKKSAQKRNIHTYNISSDVEQSDLVSSVFICKKLNLHISMLPVIQLLLLPGKEVMISSLRNFDEFPVDPQVGKKDNCCQLSFFISLATYFM
jgi:hypothetical protein